MRPPTRSAEHWNGIRKPETESAAETQLTISLNFFIGNTRTVLLAGLALKTQGSFVNGLTPLRAAFAGFFFSFMFSTPPSSNLPFFNSVGASDAETTPHFFMALIAFFFMAGAAGAAAFFVAFFIAFMAAMVSSHEC